MATVQFGLGVATVMTHVAITPAVVHQAGALGLFLACLWGVYELRHPSTVTAGADAPALPPEYDDPQRTAA
jgi:heme A synthase